MRTAFFCTLLIGATGLLNLPGCAGEVIPFGGEGDAGSPPMDGAERLSDGPTETTDLAMSVAGPLCAASGSLCGGHGVDGDVNSLYLCPQIGMPPGTSMQCMNGCEVHMDGAPDRCKSAPAMNNAPTCMGNLPGAYCGGDMVANGDPDTLYQCPGKGMAPTSAEHCNAGCSIQAPGTNDLCKAAITCPGQGDFCGGDGVSGGDVNTLYHCPAKGSAPTGSTACPIGCEVKPPGVPDVCKVALSCPGPGAYCGQDGVQGGQKDVLYDCPAAGQPPKSAMPCANGCTVQPQGVPDFCAQKLTCPTKGAYCGNDGVGGPANVLYQCNAGGQPPASSMACQSGCVVEKQGVPDHCAGSCGGQAQTALNWEANQLNTGHCWCSLCLGFVNNAYAAAGNSPNYLHLNSANDSLNAARQTGRFVNWNGSCPCGAILYWSANNCNGEFGHVVICNGDGTVSTSGWKGFGGSTHASITWLDQMECGHTPAGYIIP